MAKLALGSKWFRLTFSVVLIYFAFRKVDILSLVAEIKSVPIWIVILLLLYMVVTMVVGSARWMLLLLPNPKITDVWSFTKATYLGAFYSLFFPSAVGGDLIKWTSLLDKYPQLSKTKLLGSVLVDRVVGLSAFVVMGLLALVAGKTLGYRFPEYLLWLFVILNVGMVVGFVSVFTFDFERWLKKYYLTRKLWEVINLLKGADRRRLLVCFGLSLIAEPVWQLPFWFYSLIFGAGMSLWHIFIFMPVISLILVLPISVAGFGARESLLLYFFSQLGIADSKILAVSTFGGLMGILNNVMGGLFLLIK